MQAINPAAPRNVNPTQSTVIGAAHGAGRVTADTAGYDFDDDFFNVSFGLYRYWHQVLPPEESGACDFLRAASTVRIAFHDNTGFVRNRREMLDNLARHLARVPFPRNDVPRTLVLALPMPESMRLEMNIQGQENLAREISGYIFQEMMNASAAGMDTVDPCTLPDEIVFEWIVV
jgi:hypothetical protein